MYLQAFPGSPVYPPAISPVQAISSSKLPHSILEYYAPLAVLLQARIMLLSPCHFHSLRFFEKMLQLSVNSEESNLEEWG